MAKIFKKFWRQKLSKIKLIKKIQTIPLSYNIMTSPTCSPSTLKPRRSVSFHKIVKILYDENDDCMEWINSYKIRFNWKNVQNRRESNEV